MSNEAWLWFWIGAAVFLGIAEIFTAGFFMLPFAVGAVAAAVLAYADVGEIIQLSVFLVVSVAALIVLRRFVHLGDQATPAVGSNRFVGQRARVLEHIDPTHVWQMPQGGIDENEDPYRAALRELYEETNIRSVEKLGEIAEWLAYDIPRDIVGEAWGGKYRGQKQKWYALRFTGSDSEIDVANPAGGHDAEFIAWRWVGLRELPDLVVPFKQKTYERVIKEFAKFAR